MNVSGSSSPVPVAHCCLCFHHRYMLCRLCKPKHYVELFTGPLVELRSLWCSVLFLLDWPAPLCWFICPWTITSFKLQMKENRLQLQVAENTEYVRQIGNDQRCSCHLNVPEPPLQGWLLGGGRIHFVQWQSGKSQNWDVSAFFRLYLQELHWEWMVWAVSVLWRGLRVQRVWRHRTRGNSLCWFTLNCSAGAQAVTCNSNLSQNKTLLHKSSIGTRTFYGFIALHSRRSFYSQPDFNYFSFYIPYYDWEITNVIWRSLKKNNCHFSETSASSHWGINWLFCLSSKESNPPCASCGGQDGKFKCLFMWKKRKLWLWNTYQAVKYK